MSLEHLLNVEEKLVERAVEEVKQFAAQHSPSFQPQQQKRRFFWAKAIYDWMQENFATEVAFGHHPNFVLESRGIDYLTHLISSPLSRYEGVDVSEHYKASELGQAAVYAMLAERFGLEARIVFDDVHFPAIGIVSGMDEPVQTATGRLFSVAIADKDGKVVRVVPCYKNGFDVDLSMPVALDGDVMLTAELKSSLEPSGKAVASLIKAKQAEGLRNIAEASRRYGEALEELGEDARTLFDYGEALRSAGMFSARLSGEAAQVFRRALAADPSHRGSKTMLDYAEKAAAEANAKIEHQKVVVANGPGDVGAALFLYYLLRMEGVNDGFALAERLLTSGKARSYEDWMDLADDYCELKGNVAKAAQVLQEGIKQFPSGWVLRYKLGNLLFASGRWEEAARQLEHSVVRRFRHTSDNYFGVANAVQGNFSEAARLLRAALEGIPADPEIRRNLAVAQFWNRTPESLEQAKKELIDNLVRHRAKSDILSLLYLGATYQKQGMRKLAFNYYMRALEVNSELKVARSLLRSVSNSLTLEEALEPLRPKRTGFRPNMQPQEKRYRSVDFTQVFQYDATGRLDEALRELARLEEKASLDNMVTTGPTELRRYREILQLRKEVAENFDAATFAAVPKLTSYKSWVNGGYNADEVVIGGKIASVELHTHPAGQHIAVHYTRIAEPNRAGAEDDQPIAVVATEETEADATYQLAKQPKQPERTKVLVENPCGSVGLGPNVELHLDALVGNVTGEVGLVNGSINLQYGTVNLTLREPVEVAVDAGNVNVTGMVKVKGTKVNCDIYAPLNGITGSPLRSDFRLAISAPHGQVRIAYQPYKAAG